MYQIVIRLYEVRGRVEAYGQYTCETPNAEGLLASAHWHSPMVPLGDGMLHADMLEAGSRVCQQLAVNLTDALF